MLLGSTSPATTCQNPGKTFDDSGVPFIRTLTGQRILKADCTLGAFLGVITLQAVTVDGEPAGRWGLRDAVHLHIADPIRLTDPIPCRGALGFFCPDDTVQERVRRRLAAQGVTLRPTAPETEGRGPMLLRVAHANAGRWITVTQLRDLLGMEETRHYAKQAAYLQRTGRLDRQHAADHRPDRPRFEYRFRAWPQTPALRATTELEAGTDASEAARTARYQQTVTRRRAAITAAAAQILAVLRAAPGPVPEQDLLAAVPHLSVTAARETLTYLVHETQDALMITATTRRARATTYDQWCGHIARGARKRSPVR